jgi:hypothetical protein
MAEGESSKLWEPTEKQFLAPQEKLLILKQEVDEVTRKFKEKKPEEIKTEELYEAISQIDSFQKMAEESGDEKMPQYLIEKIEELRAHKNLGTKARMDTMAPFQKVSDPRKRPKIGTHN